VLSGALGLFASQALSCSDDDSRCDFEDFDVAGRDRNPEEISYPAGEMGASLGNVFPNFSFRGFRGSGSSDIETVSIADFYDPDRKRHKLLNVMVAAMWCPVTKGQTALMASDVPLLRPEGLEVVQAIMDGPRKATAPDRCDVEDWIERWELTFPVVFDVFAKRVGTVLTIEGVPWNALIDTRTMQVISAFFGAPTNYESYIRSGFAKLEIL
jgi:hypothetical protein